MKNEQLPLIRKDNILVKIKNYFLNLFNKRKKNTKEINITNEKQNKNEAFRGNIQTNSNEDILRLQKKLKEKQIEISSLTDDELDRMIDLYKKQIEKKEEKLKQYMKKIA